MTRSDRNKVMFGGGLLLLATVMLYRAFIGEASPPGPRAKAPEAPGGRQAVLRSLDSPGQAAAPAAGKRARASLEALDPVLRLDLLARVQKVKYEGTERNIFQFYTPPPPPPPKPVVDPVKNPGGPAPPPPVIPLKFYGFASKPGESVKKAFLSDGEDIFIAVEGDVVKKRYKVLQIGVNTIEMEDQQTKSKQKLPLQETP